MARGVVTPCRCFVANPVHACASWASMAGVHICFHLGFDNPPEPRPQPLNPFSGRTLRQEAPPQATSPSMLRQRPPPILNESKREGRRFIQLVYPFGPAHALSVISTV